MEGALFQVLGRLGVAMFRARRDHPERLPCRFRGASRARHQTSAQRQTQPQGIAWGNRARGQIEFNVSAATASPPARLPLAGVERGSASLQRNAPRAVVARAAAALEPRGASNSMFLHVARDPFTRYPFGFLWLSEIWKKSFFSNAVRFTVLLKLLIFPGLLWLPNFPGFVWLPNCPVCF